MQPLDVLGIVLAPIQIILGQIEQKLSKKSQKHQIGNNSELYIWNELIFGDK